VSVISVISAVSEKGGAVMEKKWVIKDGTDPIEREKEPRKRGIEVFKKIRMDWEKENPPLGQTSVMIDSTAKDGCDTDDTKDECDTDDTKDIEAIFRVRNMRESGRERNMRQSDRERKVKQQRKNVVSETRKAMDALIGSSANDIGAAKGAAQRAVQQAVRRTVSDADAIRARERLGLVRELEFGDNGWEDGGVLDIYGARKMTVQWKAFEYLSSVLNSPDLLAEAFKEVANVALSTIVEVMENRSLPAGTRLKAAEYVLDRVMGRPTASESITVSDGRPAAVTISIIGRPSAPGALSGVIDAQFKPAAPATLEA
jgi:hypothetical protein